MTCLYVYDLDGTISQTKYPRPHTPINLLDAIKIMDPLRVAQDKPRVSVISWMQHIRLYAGRSTSIYILTGRPEAARRLTEAWLLVNGVPYDDMVMVGTPDCEPTHMKKRQHLETWKKEFSSVLVVDDDPSVGELCAELRLGFVNAKEI